MASPDSTFPLQGAAITPVEHDVEKVPVDAKEVPASTATSTSSHDCGLAYIPELAEAGEKWELTFQDKPWSAVKAEGPLILYGILISLAVISEGYALSLSTGLFAFPAFVVRLTLTRPVSAPSVPLDVPQNIADPAQESFGEYDPITGQYEMAFKWHTLLPIACNVGSVFGTIMGGRLVSVFGYRRLIFWAAACSMMLIFLPFFARNPWMLFAGFLARGIPSGMYQIIGPSYAAEQAGTHTRPMLTTWGNMCWVVGQTLAAVILTVCQRIRGGWSYRVAFALEWVLTIILVLGTVVSPESAYWLLKKQMKTRQEALKLTGARKEALLQEADRLDDVAQNVVRRMLSKNFQSEAPGRLHQMKRTLVQEEITRRAAAGDTPPPRGMAKFRASTQQGLACFQGCDARRTWLSISVWVIQALCGSAMIPWVPYLLLKVGMSPNMALGLNIGLNCMAIFGVVLSWSCMRVMGHKQLFMLGLILMSIPMCIMGVLGVVQISNGSNLQTGIGVAVSLMVFTALYDISVGPLTFAIVTELPSIQFKAMTVAFARAIYVLTTIIFQFVIPLMLREDGRESFGARSGFIWAALCLFTATYTYFFLPETKNINTRQLNSLFCNKLPARKFSREKANQLLAEAEAPSDLASDRTLLVATPATDLDKPETQSGVRVDAFELNNLEPGSSELTIVRAD